MNKYLYIFGYETPEQQRSNAAHGWDDEDSAAVFIVAEDEQHALEWGHAISQELVSLLFKRQDARWDAHRFAAWIDRDYATGSLSADALHAIPIVKRGEYPNIPDMLLAKYGETAAAGSPS